MPPNDGVHGTAGSGCRPRDDTALSDGVWMVEVVDVASTGLGLDLVCYTTPVSADGGGSRVGPEGEVTNDSALVRDVPLAPGAPFFLQAIRPPDRTGPRDVRRFTDPGAAAGFLADVGERAPLAWVLVEGGQVVEVYEPPLDRA